MGVCLGKSRVLDRKPVAYLTCNGSPPVEGKPSLMTFSEATSPFEPLPQLSFYIYRCWRSTKCCPIKSFHLVFFEGYNI